MNSVRTSQEAYYFSAIKSNRLTLFRRREEKSRNGRIHFGQNSDFKSSMTKRIETEREQQTNLREAHESKNCIAGMSSYKHNLE
jgi:hypothetical protein